jgi:glucose-1-phosphate adenylyltransferase
MRKLSILALVMAGGEGTRLHPLTAERSKPAVPFGGRYRIVDFVLSNLINSEIHSIYLLVQYKAQSLIEHVRKAWMLSPIIPGYFVTVVPPQMRVGAEWFQGTADAVFQNINLIHQYNPDFVVVFGADHVYRMDVRQMLNFHRERQADASIAALRVPIEQASRFGIIAVDTDGGIQDFQEKPAHPARMPTERTCAYASMGNYIFSTHVLIKALMEAKERGENDFGKHVLPRLMHTHRLLAYDFATNRVPGVKPYEEKGYWRDLGTIDAYFAANIDTLGPRPRFDLYNPQWPIYSSHYYGPVVKVNSGEIHNSVLGAGTLVNGARLRNSVVRREVILEDGAELDECIVMDYVRIKKGARLRRVIVDRYNTVEEGAEIGYDLEKDRGRYWVTDSGIVVLPEGKTESRVRTYLHEQS